MNLRDLEERGIVMNSKMICRTLISLCLAFLASCGSSKVIPTTDVCSLKKHWKDNIFQVQINGEALNKNYYTFDEAKDITKRLADQNKCMP